MEASVVSAQPRPGAAARTAPPPAEPALWPVYAVLFASTSVIVGVLWDISWHQTIGRDTFWSPPHMAIYLGGLVAGIACGAHVLLTTFVAPPGERAAGVTFWKYFRGPLGAWLCIWGCFAMLTSAPFDDWWHNAYGLDVKILSPPHAVLALGILAIQIGALFMVLALQNRAEQRGDPSSRRFRWLYAYASGLLVLNFAVMFSEYTWRIMQHGTLFYQVVAVTLVAPLVAAAVAGGLRWPATAAAGAYTLVLLALHFILPLFPAEPLLAPVRYPIDRMMPPQFPLLLIAPAFAMDLALRRVGTGRPWRTALLLGPLFVVVFVAVQWPFADLLNSELAHNWFFKQDMRPYMVPAESAFAQGRYIDAAAGSQLGVGLLVAAALAVAGARLGLGWGAWMARVRR